MKSDIEFYIVQKVMEFRDKLDITQEEIADHLKVSQSFIHKIENPKFNNAYNFDHINAIAKLFKCSLWELIPKYPL